MLLTVHALTGVALGTVIQNPVLLAPTAVASHFACDSVPHFGMKASFKSPKGFLVGSLDFAGALTVLTVCTLLAPQRALQTLVGGIGAIFPDLFYLSEIFFKTRLSGRMGDFHHFIQWSETLRGTVIDLAWGSLMVWLIVQRLL